MKNEFRRQQARKITFLPFEKERLPQITQPGLYWFTDLMEKKWFVQIMADGTASKLEVGTLYPFIVDSVGVGEFVGPLPI